MSEDVSLVSVKEKIHSFEKKHGCRLGAFEDRIKQLPEDFELWDDLIEWKAYADSLSDLEIRDQGLKCCQPQNRFRILSLKGS